MANIRKSFNFRNGVQVDNDNLVVTPSGLVGIGTTIPTVDFDVRGDVKVVGLVSVSQLNVTGVATFQQANVIGVITATAFYGNGSTLSNLPTSQWVDSDVGLGFTSIYAAGNVGVGTTDPRNIFQVGANPNTGGRGIGFNSTGDIRASGVVTAYNFVGFGTNISGLNADNITSGTILNTYLPTIDNSKFPTNINISGIVTASGGFIGTLTGSLIGVAQSASSLSGTPNINVGIITSTSINISSLNVGSGGTAFIAKDSGKVGIGTTDPTSEFQIIKQSNPLLEVISNTGGSTISVGQSVGVGKSTGLFRFGNTPKTLEIINNDTGNINSYLHVGSSGIGTGKFSWIYGQTNSELMSLNYDGTLTATKNIFLGSSGIGTVTVKDNLYVDNNLIVNGTVSASSFNLPSILNRNIYATSGVSTVTSLHIFGGFNRIGVGTNNPLVGVDARNQTAFFQTVGINTDVTIYSLSVNGATSSTGGFTSGTGSPVKISVSGNSLIFTVDGIGSTTLTLS